MPPYHYWLWLFCPVLLYAQEGNYFKDHYAFQQKIAEHPVLDILQDQRGFMWLATYAGLVRYDGQTEKYFSHDPTDSLSLKDNILTALAERADGQLWVGSMNNGIYLFDPTLESFVNFRHEPGNIFSLPSNRINRIHVSQRGTTWVTTERGVARFDSSRMTFVTLPSTPPNTYSYAITEREDGAIFIGTYNGIDRWDSARKQLTAWVTLPKNCRIIKAIYPSQQGWWVGLQSGGLQKLRQQAGNWGWDSLSPLLPADLRQGDIWDIQRLSGDSSWVIVGDKNLYHIGTNEQRAFVNGRYTLTRENRFMSAGLSQDGVLWIGTNDGVNSLAPRYKIFQHTSLRPPDLDKYTTVTALQPAPNHELWIGNTWGIRAFSIPDQALNWNNEGPTKDWNPTKNGHATAIHFDGQHTTYASFTEGFGRSFSVFSYDHHDKGVINISAHHPVLASTPTRCLQGGPQQTIWIGTDTGLFHYYPTNDSLVSITAPVAGEFRVSTLRSESDGTIWVGTYGFGLWKYDASQAVWTSGYDEMSWPIPSRSKTISAITREKWGKRWIGSASGLFCYDQQRDTLWHFTENDGLWSNEIKNIIATDSTQAWFSNNRYLGKIDLSSRHIDQYGPEAGIQVHMYNKNISAKDTSGRLYFGGSNGLTIFHPAEILSNPFLPKVIFSQLELSNQVVDVRSSDGVLQKELPYQDVITLRHDQNIFTIHFTALGFIHPEQHTYISRLEGFETDWQDLGTKNQLTYTNLSPGRYQLYVKAANNDGKWHPNPSVLTIIIRPAWYNSTLAWLVYLFLTALGLYVFYRIQLNRRLAVDQAAYLQQVNTIRANFYTNVTHEFRTPLTLIQGPVEQAMNDQAYQLNSERLSLIYRNCQRLLQLIDRLLMINQLNDGQMILAYTHGDIRVVIKSISALFSDTAHQKNLQFEQELPHEEINMDYDQSAFSDILNNLLSNAIKFTPAGGQVRLHAYHIREDSTPSLLVDVFNSDPLITQAERKKIFQRFYRSPSAAISIPTVGSGVGLALSRQLARMLGGDLQLLEGTHQGNTFRLQLPIKNSFSSTPMESIDRIHPGPQKNRLAPSAKASGQPTVLIAEDEQDMAHYLIDCLRGAYDVHHRENGHHALSWAQENTPDLIVSDVMMPGLNGFDLCKALKSNPITSHIPIILLTARIDMEARLTGLERGADAYLNKPFDTRELLIRCQQLLQLREKLGLFYQRIVTTNTTKIPPPTKPLDEQEYQFMKQVRTVITENLANDQFGTPELAAAVAMSRQQLFRKLRDLAQTSPSDLIKTLRLQKAENMLQDPSYSIAEVAYACGFRDPDYFGRLFRKTYGNPPSEYRKKTLW